MASQVEGIDPDRESVTLGIVDNRGVEITHETFDNNAVGHLGAVDLSTTHGVELVGGGGSASWGAHIAITGQGAVFVETKTTTSARTVTMPPRLVAVLTDHLDTHVKPGAECSGLHQQPRPTNVPPRSPAESRTCPSPRPRNRQRFLAEQSYGYTIIDGVNMVS